MRLLSLTVALFTVAVMTVDAQDGSDGTFPYWIGNNQYSECSIGSPEYPQTFGGCQNPDCDS